MPIYEYKCNNCCHCFEKLVLSSNDPPPWCPECTCVDVEKQMSVACVRPQGVPTGSGGFSEPRPGDRASG